MTVASNADVRRFKSYPTYKDSGIEELGEIPADWQVTPLKHLTDFTTGWTPPTGREDLYDGDNPWANIGDLGPTILTSTDKAISDRAIRESRLQVVTRGSLLFSFKLSVGAVSIAGVDLYTNEAIAAFSPSSLIRTSYLFWAAPVLIPRNAQENIYGAPLLSRDRIANAKLLVPSASEQDEIASFLDQQTAKIDVLVAKKERLIELLQEKRTALITRAVTRGLDPNVPMKDSGVEWLGEIPAHWEVKRLRSTLTSCQNGMWGDEPDGVHDVICVRVADFDRVGFRVDVSEPTLRSIEPRIAADRGLHNGDLLLEKSGGGELQPVGALVMYDHDVTAVCSNFIARVTVASGHDARFLTYLHASLYSQRLNTRHIKQSTGIQNLDSSSYFDESVGLPGLAEQCAIAAFLDRETAKIDALIAKVREAIERLKELRSALISAAVTGKIDVRGEAA